MKRERDLRRRMHTLQTLSEAVSAMKSLSAHHFRLSRIALPAAREYRREVDAALAEVGNVESIEHDGPPALLLVVSDLGLCGDYNTRLVELAIKELRREGGLLYCIGERPKAALQREGTDVVRAFAGPTSVDGLPNLLLELAQDLLDGFFNGSIGSLRVVSAQFEGAGRFSASLTRVLPIEVDVCSKTRLRPTTYQRHSRLAAVAVREYLYTTLYELLLDALAAEHGMRLVAAQSAQQWLDKTSESVERQLSASRREATTQEVLDIVAGTAGRYT